MFNFEGIDGKNLLNAMLIAKAEQEGDKMTGRIVKIFEKYKLSFFDGVALLVEVCAAIENEIGGESDV